MTSKHKPKPCNCGAYDHPHKLDGSKCKARYNNDFYNHEYFIVDMNSFLSYVYVEYFKGAF